jgi:hypothetical protein
MRAARALVSPVSPQEEPLLREEVERLTRLVKSRNALIKELKQTLAYEASHRRPRMTRKLHKQIRSLLHPDRAPNDEQMRRKLESAFQDFNAVEFEFHPDGVT